jgi:hypothetical protein
MNVSIKEVRDRIGSVSNTKKITEAMKLVAAAKVRRAQEAVVNGRPFAENLVKVGAGLYGWFCVCLLSAVQQQGSWRCAQQLGAGTLSCGGVSNRRAVTGSGSAQWSKQAQHLAPG